MNEDGFPFVLHLTSYILLRISFDNYIPDADPAEQ